MIGETKYKTTYHKTTKKNRAKHPNVSCRLMENPDTKETEFILEAMDYDTLWKLYIYHILGVAYHSNPQEEVHILKHIALKLYVDPKSNVWMYPGDVSSLIQELPGIPKDHIKRILHWYESIGLWGEDSDHCEALSILVQPIEVLHKGRGLYEYSYYDDGMLRSPMKLIYQATGREKIQ